MAFVWHATLPKETMHIHYYGVKKNKLLKNRGGNVMRIIPVVNIPTGRMVNAAKGNALNQKFVKLGTLVGKSYQDI